MLMYDWPRNVRELQTALDAAVALARDATITTDNLPEEVRATLTRRPPAWPALKELEQVQDPGNLREQLVSLLSDHKGNVSAVARVMGKTRAQIHRWAKRFGIEFDDFRDG